MYQKLIDRIEAANTKGQSLIRQRIEALQGTLFVAFTSGKGGCGKTTDAMMLAYGAARSFNKQVIQIHTDLDKPEISDNIAKSTRPYVIADCSNNPDAMPLADAIEIVENNNFDICCIDSGANRPDVDYYLGELSDIVLVPAMHDTDSLLRAAEKIANNDKAFVVMNNYRNSKKSEADQKHVDDKILAHIPEERIAHVVKAMNPDGHDDLLNPAISKGFSSTQYAELRRFANVFVKA